MRTTAKTLIAVAVALAFGFGVGSSVNLHGNIINADTGYQLGAAAAQGHILVGNGTYYVDQTYPPLVTNSCTSYSSSSTSGCTVLPDGKWEEWATGPTESANYYGTQSATFPVPFPTACLSVQLTTSTPSPITGNGAAYANYLQSCSTTAATFTMDVGPDGVGTVSHATIVWVIGD